jgi:hypothetical protein
MPEDSGPDAGLLFTAAIVFIGAWIYCIATYGFLLGVGLGWLPSLIVAVIAGLLWRIIFWLLVVVMAIIAYLLLRAA